MQSIITISSKRQITIPAEICQALDLQPGGRLVVKVEDGKIVLSNPSKSYTDLLAGTLQGVYGKTREDVDEYLRKERGAWE